MTSSSATDSSSVPETTNLQRKSNDVGWEFGMLINPNILDKMKCKLCGKEFSRGIYRLKQHVAKIQGNVAACPNSTKEDKKVQISNSRSTKQKWKSSDGRFENSKDGNCWLKTRGGWRSNWSKRNGSKQKCSHAWSYG